MGIANAAGRGFEQAMESNVLCTEKLCKPTINLFKENTSQLSLILFWCRLDVKGKSSALQSSTLQSRLQYTAEQCTYLCVVRAPTMMGTRWKGLPPIAWTM